MLVVWRESNRENPRTVTRESTCQVSMLAGGSGREREKERERERERGRIAMDTETEAMNTNYTTTPNSPIKW